MKKIFAAHIVLLQAFVICALADNSVVNMSHYDLMRVDFVGMKREGIVGAIHEASYPRFERDAYYRSRQQAATRAGLLWGAYHFGDATDPVKQADHFLRCAGGPSASGTLLVLDFEKNNHYPGKSMRVDQAVTFVERIRERTGKYPGLYGSEYRLRQMLYAKHVTPAQRRTLSNCWLWIANYHFIPRNTAPWNNWQMWQYTGDGKCDLRPRSKYPISVANIRKAERNFFRGNNNDLEVFWQQNGWRPSAE